MKLVLPLMDPATIPRGQWHEEPAQVQYLRHLREVLDGERIPEDIHKDPPRTLSFPTLATLQGFDRAGPDYDHLSLDIENAGKYLLCIGLTWFNTSPLDVGPTLVLPFRVYLGHKYWRWDDHVHAVEHLDNWLGGHHTKVFHNGVTHDVPLLRGMGFRVKGPWLDTMYLTHWLYPEMRKGLQYQCTLHLGMPHWKALLDEDDEEEGKG